MGPTRRLAPAALPLLILLVACGGGELSMSEYIEEVNASTQQANDRSDAINAQAPSDPTPQQLQAVLERGVNEVRIPLQEAGEKMSAPQQIADLHQRVLDWHGEFIAIEQDLASRIGTTPDTDEGWTAFSNSPEVAAYRASLAEGNQVCADLHGIVDERAARGRFADTPWLPDEVSRAVQSLIGCAGFPEDPGAVYRYP